MGRFPLFQRERDMSTIHASQVSSSLCAHPANARVHARSKLLNLPAASTKKLALLAGADATFDEVMAQRSSSKIGGAK